LGICYIQLRRYGEAVGALRQAVAREEANPSYHTALGEILVYRGSTEDGRRHYERALQLDPDYGPALGQMGSFYLNKVPGLDAQDRAEELLLRATRRTTYHPEQVYLDLGKLYTQKGEYRRAIDALQKSISID